MYPNYQNDTESDDGAISAQLPSFVDVVFILLIFFLVLSIVGFGLVEKGDYAKDVYTKEEDISNYPAVPKALHKEFNDYLTLSLEKDAEGDARYYLYSNALHLGVAVLNPEDYQNLRAKIDADQSVFMTSAPLTPLDILESTWGPFPDANSMHRSPIVQKAVDSALIIQATEDFTYHEILQVMRLFRKFNVVYFEVIENGAGR